MELPVIVSYVQFRNEKGFAILSCELDAYSAKYRPEMEDLVKDAISEKYGTFTVTIGILDQAENPSGGQYIFVGEFVTNVKYGRQFKAEFFYQDAPTTEDGLRAFLMTLPNIKESRSNAIIQKYGVQGTMDILDNNPEKLVEINGITEKRIGPIKKVWEEKKYMRTLYEWLTTHGIQVGLADKIYRQWGKESLRVISENPYNLVELRGIGFVTADNIAHKILKQVPKQSRITACIKYVLEENTYSNSNLCLPYSDLKKNVLSIITECDQNLDKKTNSESCLSYVPLSLKSDLDNFAVVKDKKEEKVYVYLRSVWERELYIAEQLYARKEFDNDSSRCTDIDVERAERDLSERHGREVKLDETQKMAIKSAFNHKMTIITGPGGSGKSTICRAIFYLSQEKGMSIRMMSPTGKAAQVLSDKTGCGSATIHRSLHMRPGDDDPHEDIKEDIVIIDEISMSGIDTMYAIMSAMETNTWGNIVFVGDKNQFTVLPGNFLSDMIESGCCNVVELDKIHRQDENSYISLLANDISKGKVVTIPQEATDIKWKDLSPDTFKEDLLSFVDKYIKDGNDMANLQIISPMKKGMCGVFAINEAMQDKMSTLNGTKDKCLYRAFNKFYVGDRVIQIENNYEKMVFNGDMGVVIDVGEKAKDASVSDLKEKFITVEFYGKPMTYFGDEIDEIHLSWAITVHKFQGSQCRNIVFVMASEAQIMFNKELAYTAFTRSEKMLYIFGNQQMLRIAPIRSAIRKRYTNLVGIINGLKHSETRMQVMGEKK